MNKDLNKTTNQGSSKYHKYELAHLIEAFKSSPTSDAKKLKTEIRCWILWNLFLSLIN